MRLRTDLFYNKTTGIEISNVNYSIENVCDLVEFFAFVDVQVIFYSISDTSDMFNMFKANNITYTVMKSNEGLLDVFIKVSKKQIADFLGIAMREEVEHIVLIKTSGTTMPHTIVDCSWEEKLRSKSIEVMLGLYPDVGILYLAFDNKYDCRNVCRVIKKLLLNYK